MENLLRLMGESMLGNLRMGKLMVKEYVFSLMEESMRENGRMGINMVKEQQLLQMGISMKGNGRIKYFGMDQNMTKTESL